MKSKNARRGGMASVQCIFLVGALVGATLFHVWQKVEMARVAGGIDAAHARMGQLRQERAKLLAAVAIKSNPTHVEQIAVEELGMVRPSRQPSSHLAHWGGE
ncbi:MAG: hypothetical protein CME20_16045 [Gemmatimonadetes bacterium]|nr:hypothetical protein [Gemmatimonadota bacterium]